GAFEARYHVAHGVVAHVPHMDAPRRIGEHLQHVVFLARVVVAGGEDAPLVPDLLPAGLGLAGILAFARHRIVSRVSSWLGSSCLGAPRLRRKNTRCMLINRASRSIFRAALGHESADAVNGSGPLPRAVRGGGSGEDAADFGWRAYL